MSTLEGPLGVIYAVGVIIALYAAGIGIGLEHSIREILAPLRRGGLLGRVVLVDVVILPLLVWALIQVFEVPAGYATGLLLVGVASAGPLGIKAAQIAGADTAAAVSLVVVLELANLAAIPIWSHVLLPSDATPATAQILRTLVVAVVLPLALGFGAKRFLPALCSRLAPALPGIASAALVAAVVAAIIRDGHSVVDAFGERVPLVAVVSVSAALVLGWVAGAPGRQTRATAALVTGIRANALALAVAASSFAGRSDVRAGAVVFALFSVIVPLAAALVLGRKLHTASPPTVGSYVQAS